MLDASLTNWFFFTKTPQCLVFFPLLSHSHFSSLGNISPYLFFPPHFSKHNYLMCTGHVSSTWLQRSTYYANFLKATPKDRWKMYCHMLLLSSSELAAQHGTGSKQVSSASAPHSRLPSSSPSSHMSVWRITLFQKASSPTRIPTLEAPSSFCNSHTCRQACKHTHAHPPALLGKLPLTISEAVLVASGTCLLCCF